MSMKKHITALFLFALALAGPNAYAQKGQPLEISAEKSLEWLRDDKIFIARQNARATQGETSISADTLTARYRDKDGNDMDIYEMTADNNVVINNNENNAYGDKVVYDVDQAMATMTGENLRMVGTDQTLTADDRFEYWVNKGKLIAYGNAIITRPKPNGRGKDTLKSDKIVATLTENERGERVLKTLEATEKVTITTPAETLTGNYAIYNAASNIAEIKGSVRIRRGPNILEGARAEVDLNTNVSKLFGAPTQEGTGRVRGVFFPDSQ